MRDSWLLGAVGSASLLAKIRLLGSSLDETALLSGQNAIILSPQQSPTCLRHQSESHRFAVSGTVMVENSGGGHELLDSSAAVKALPQLMAGVAPGQFAGAFITSDGISLKCDNNGLRSIYLRRVADGVVFSTHLHLITEVTGSVSLNLELFGSHWLCHNQLERGIFVEGVERLCGTDTMSLSMRDGRPEVRRASACPPPLSSEGPFDWLTRFFDGFGPEIWLSLSGGLDSRFLLSLLTQKAERGLETFVFGADTSPDVVLAKRVAQIVGVRCTHVRMDNPGQLSQDELTKYARDNWCTPPLHAAGHLTQYRGLAIPNGAVIVDGGFGEIARRQFYRRIEILRLRERLQSVPLAAYRRALAFPRVDAFRPAAITQMNAGIDASLRLFREWLLGVPGPAPEDVLAATLRRENFFGLTQSWMDSHAPSIMPLAQEPFVSGLLKLRRSSRAGGSAYKRRIKRWDTRLADLRLAKGQYCIPFSLPSVLHPLYTRAVTPQSIEPPTFWNTPQVRELLFDTVRSAWVRESDLLDDQKAVRILDRFYNGHEASASAASWLGSLLLWMKTNHVK
ncbi:MAG: hypothetical protein ACI80V_001350 [Rhodothermales bacterium]